MEDLTSAEHAARKPRLRKTVLFTALGLAFVCYAFFQWVLWPVKVMGESMLPTYHDGTRHFINKLAYRWEKPQRGDVVGVRVRPGEIYVKRIVGMPGEKVEVVEGRILINGHMLKEPYTRKIIPDSWDVSPVELGPDFYFVAGDNRAVSVLGPVPGERIIGKVVH